MANVELEAEHLRKREPFSLDFSLNLPGIVPVLFVGLVLRLALALLPGFGIDIGSFEAWSQRLADKGPWGFYSPDVFSDYAPGYLYVLWFIGELNKVFHFSNGEFARTLGRVLRRPAFVPAPRREDRSKPTSSPGR